MRLRTCSTAAVAALSAELWRFGATWDEADLLWRKVRFDCEEAVDDMEEDSVDEVEDEFNAEGTHVSD